MNHQLVKSRACDQQAESLWKRYQDISWGNDPDLIHFSKFLDRVTDLADKKFSMLFRMLKASCERTEWEIEVLPTNRFKIGFFPFKVPSEEMFNLKTLKQMASVIRRRSLHLFWHVIRISNAHLSKINLKTTSDIRKFFQNNQNALLLTRVEKIACRMIGNSSLTFFPRELVALSGLRGLTIQNFGLIFLPNRFFQNFDFLQKLELSNNLLVDWSMDKTCLPNLKKLSLASNQIKSCRISRIQAGVLKVNLKHNPVLKIGVYFF